MKFTLTLFLSIFFSLPALLAKDYQGYVILNNDEKIEGTIQMLSPTLNEVKVKLTDKAGKHVTYKSKEIKEYSFQVEKWNNETRVHDLISVVYVRKNVERPPVAFGPTEVLIQREVNGIISLYNHFIEQRINPNEPFSQVIYVEKNREKLIAVDKENFVSILKNMTAEYPELSAKIGSRGYGIKHIAEIVTAFNTWMIDNGEEVVLEM